MAAPPRDGEGAADDARLAAEAASVRQCCHTRCRNPGTPWTPLKKWFPGSVPSGQCDTHGTRYCKDRGYKDAMAYWDFCPAVSFLQ